MKIGFISKHDSSIKANASLAHIFTKEKHEVFFYILDAKSPQNELLVDRFSVPGEITYYPESQKLFESESLANLDVIHIVTHGLYIQQLTYYLHERFSNAPHKKPFVITGLIGVLGGALYHFYNFRQLCDLIYTTGDFDKTRIQKVAKKWGHNKEKIISTGLPILDYMANNHHKISAKTSEFEETIVFIGQPTFPSSYSDRKWVLKKLIELAIKFPQKKVILKPRVKFTEQTIHLTQFHYSSLLEEWTEEIPQNFSINYDNIQNIILMSDLIISISSTALLEAIVANKNIAIISDFGISETWGNHVFLDSGAITSFNEIMNNKRPKLDVTWKENYFNQKHLASELIYNKVKELLENKASNSNIKDLNNYRYYNHGYLKYIYEKKQIPQKKVIQFKVIFKKIIISFLKFLFKSKFFNKATKKTINTAKKWILIAERG